MARKKETTEDKIAQNAATAVIREQVLKELSEKDPNQLEFSSLADDSIDRLIDEVGEVNEVDIFQDIGAVLAKKGDIITYYIKKDGEFICNKKHPYSIEKLQSEHGAGYYNVVARSSSLGRIVKQCSYQIGEAPVDSKNEPVGLDADSVEAILAKREKNEHLSMSDVFLLMEKANERAERKAAEERRTQSENMNTMITAISTIIGGTQKAPVQDSQAPVVSMIERLMDKQDRVMEKIMDKLTQKPEKNQNDLGLNQLQVMEMIKDAEDRGFSRYKELIEMADQKAEEKMELIQATKGDAEPDSAINSLIKAFLPTITTALSPETQAKAEAMEVQRRNQMIHMQRQQAASHAAQAARTAPPVKTHVSNPTPQAKPVARDVNSILTGSKPVPQKPVERTETVNAPQMSEKKRRIISVVEPLLRETLPKLVMANEARRLDLAKTSALETLAKLDNQGIKQQDVLSEFSLENLLYFIEAYKLPVSIKPWFERYYRELSVINTVVKTAEAVVEK